MLLCSQLIFEFVRRAIDPIGLSFICWRRCTDQGAKIVQVLFHLFGAADGVKLLEQVARLRKISRRHRQRDISTNPAHAIVQEEIDHAILRVSAHPLHELIVRHMVVECCGGGA